MSAISPHIKMAMSADFLAAFARVPRPQQNKVLDFLDKFRTDPTMPGINFEKIRQARDPRLRSVRIDDTYRGIVFKPDKGDVYVLLYLDHHDDAYDWASNKRCMVHPEVGSLQLVDVSHTPEDPSSIAMGRRIEAETGLFAKYRDRELLKIGVPPEMLPEVRGLCDEGDLERCGPRLPEEALEGLSYLASGIPLDEVLRALEREPEHKVDENDFFAALDHPDSKRRFFVVDDELELAAMLHAPLEKWRVFLHPSQRNLVERDWNGPVRTLGGAGTGKTVVALHRAKWLAAKRFTGPSDRILFTTFTKNLAADIEKNLKEICSSDTMRHIEVINLDRWAAQFLRHNGYDCEIAFPDTTKPLWEKALDLAPEGLGFPNSFYREEWEEVIQPQEIQSLEEYAGASRVGRGTRLSRGARKEVWPVFEEYRLALSARRLREPEDALADARRLLESKGGGPYRAVIVDEAQDMGVQAFKLIARLVRNPGARNAIFIVGDGRQRIYRRKVVLSRTGINVTGRSKTLKINYRTTDETRRWAVKLMEGRDADDLDGGTDDQRGYRSLLHGEPPIVKAFDSPEKEIAAVEAFLRKIDKEEGGLANVCLTVRTRSMLKDYESRLINAGFTVCLLDKDKADDRSVPGVRIATMHRVKGLEFDWVIIAGMNKGIMPLAKAVEGSEDPVSRADAEFRERALLYVAATRAKKGVLVTSYGEPGDFLEGM
jgi:superfamily I DNA/RNA helicase